MNVAPTEKWIQGASPDDPTNEVAVRTLQSRLGAVLHFLPLAAEKPEEDPDYVHQLRVWSRRATAALRLYEDWMPHRRFKWMTKQLKRLRRAANEARDCDVLLARLPNHPSRHGRKHWLAAVRNERAEAQKEIVAVHERLFRDHRFAWRIDNLLARVSSYGREKDRRALCRFGDWAHEHLRPAVQRFFAAVPSDRTDEAALHRFRIRGKELRYVMELLAGAFPDRLRTRLYPVIEAIQDRLGQINDLATARARLRNKIKAASHPAAAAAWQRLLAKEQRQFDQARQKFWQWCTLEMFQELRAGFEALLSRGAGNGRVTRRTHRE
jgi:CHAD domain-containing protein